MWKAYLLASDNKRLHLLVPRTVALAREGNVVERSSKFCQQWTLEQGLQFLGPALSHWAIALLAELEWEVELLWVVAGELLQPKRQLRFM